MSIGERVWHAAMQLVEATCRPDVTQQAPSSLKALNPPLALWTFPLARIHPHCLDNSLTIEPSSIVCLFAFFMLWASLKNKNNFKKHTQTHMRAEAHTGRNACIYVCCLFVEVHVQLPSSSVFCGLLSWLLFIKEYCWRLLGFPHSHHQSTKHSPTLFYSLPAACHWSPSRVYAFVLIPFTLKLATTKHNLLQSVHKHESKGAAQKQEFVLDVALLNIWPQKPFHQKLMCVQCLCVCSAIYYCMYSKLFWSALYKMLLSLSFSTCIIRV